MLSPVDVLSSNIGLSIIAVIALVLLAKWLLEHLPTRPSGDQPTTIPQGITLTPKSILSPTENRFFHSLRLAVGDDYEIFVQLPMWTLVNTHAHTPKILPGFTNQIRLKRVDFVLVHATTLAVKLVIELDDAAHLRGDRRTRGVFVDHVLAQAGIPVVHIRLANSYTPQSLRSQLGLSSPQPLEA